MAAPNGNGRAFATAVFLAGLLVGGFGGVVRGDWLGREAAQEVETRAIARDIAVTARISTLESDYKTISSQLARIEGMLRTRNSQER